MNAATRRDQLSALVRQRTASFDGPASARDVCVVCVEVLCADGAALTLTSARRRSALVCTVGEHGRHLADLQFALEEGPKVEVLNTGERVLVDDLTSVSVTRRWPRLATAAVELGIRAVHAFPLGPGTSQLGVLQLYRDVPHSMTDDELTDAQIFAELALDALLDQDPVAPELREAGLGGRAVLYQATGVLSVELGVPLDDALQRLRSYARENDIPITEVAQAVVTGELRLPAE